MKVSELIAELAKVLAEHGDLLVYSTTDYDFVREVEVLSDGLALASVAGPLVVLDS